MVSEKKIYGLLGKGIGYSLSPKMHNAAFKHFGIEAEYKLFDKNENELEKFFQEEVLVSKIAGFNVTVPYKVKIREMLLSCNNVEFHPIVDIIGALNTVRVDKGKIFAANTDVDGFWDALREDAEMSGFPKLKVFIIGAGGAGRAIALYLAYSKFSEKIYVYDVDKKKLTELKTRFSMMLSQKEVSIKSDALNTIETDKDISEKIKDCTLVVNATPLGTKEGEALPLDTDLLQKNMTVYDLVYARETELMKRAKEKGLKAVGGLGMLVNQAAHAFRIWTGKHDKEVKKIMREAILAELKPEVKRMYKWAA